MTDAATATLHLIEVMARLRHPETGCAWDQVQDFATIAPYTIEEAYEVEDAIARGEPADPAGRTRRPAVPGGLSRPHGGGARLVRLRRRGRARSPTR